MDREIQYGHRLSTGTLRIGMLTAVCALFLSNQTMAQGRGGFGGGGGFQPPSPEEMFSRLDANRDGNLSETEIRNSFMSRAFRDRDLSGGMSQSQFAEEMARFRERFGRGRGGDGDRRRDRDREDENGGDGDRGNEGESSEPGTSTGGNGTTSPVGTSGASSAAPGGRPRVTIDLQPDLLSGDSDRDGQIGLYEWRRFQGRSLREFHQLDLNRDGFVTPREYATVHPESTPVAVPAATPATQPAPAATTATTDAGAGAVATPATGDPAAATPPADDNTTRDAATFFRLLDRNNDGQIVSSEWQDGRIRRMFIDGGIDLSQPLVAAEFSRHYIRLSANE